MSPQERTPEYPPEFDDCGECPFKAICDEVGNLLTDDAQLEAVKVYVRLLPRLSNRQTRMLTSLLHNYAPN